MMLNANDQSVRASIEFNGPLNALSTSPNSKLVAVGGRDVLKIVALEASGFSEKRNLRAGITRINYSTNDIRWHPHSPSLLATAATNGSVDIWNLQNEGFKQVQECTLSHDRAVNRICWHTTDWNLLLSGCQDRKIRLWDKRGRIETVFSPRAEVVRDVRFSKFEPNKFAAAFENGYIHIWDIRKTNAPETKIQAHNGLILTIDWHPTKPNVLASGGRDRYVNIWDLKDNVRQRIHTIQTIASVGRVAWRPNNENHIMTCSSLLDHSIHVWDIQRPCIPIASFKGHSDIASGISWLDTPADSLGPGGFDLDTSTSSTHDIGSEGDTLNYWQHVLACSKDETLKLHSLADAFKPHQSLPTTTLALHSNGKVAFSHDIIDRSCVTLDIHEHKGMPGGIFTVDDTSQWLSGRPKNSPGSDFSPYSLQGGVSNVKSGKLPSTPLLKASEYRSSLASTPEYPSKSGASAAARDLYSIADHASPKTESIDSASTASMSRQDSRRISASNLINVNSAGIVSSSASVLSRRNTMSSRGPITGGVGPNTVPSTPPIVPRQHSTEHIEPLGLRKYLEPQAIISCVNLENSVSSNDMLKIFHGELDGLTIASEKIAFIRAQLENGDYLKDSFGFDEASFRFLADNYIFGTELELSLSRMDLIMDSKVMPSTSITGARISDTPNISMNDCSSSDQHSTSLSFSDMCASNALAAFVCNKPAIVHMWRMLELLYEDGHDELVDEIHEGVNDIHSDSANIHGHSEAVNHTIARESINSNEITDSISEQSQTSMLLEQLDYVNPQAGVGFEAYPYASTMNPTIEKRQPLTSTNPQRNRMTNVQTSQAYKRDNHAYNRASGASVQPSPRNVSRGDHISSLNNSSHSYENGHMAWDIHGNAVQGDVSHLKDTILKELLEYYADQGDLQTCVAIIMVVRSVTNVENLMGKGWLQQIYMQYIDLLHQLRIYCAANVLVKTCSDASIRQMNMKSTSIYANCSRCSKPLIDFGHNSPSQIQNKSSFTGAVCGHCNNMAARCSICQLPVKGLYVWCSVCSHGGHFEHMNEWFESEEVCPTGCSHRCTFRTTAILSNNNTYY